METVSPARAIIFDMDGVIVDSTRIHTEAWDAYLRSCGIDLPDAGQRMLGRHNDDIVRDFFRGHSLTPETILAHGARKEKLYRDLMTPVLSEHLVPGISGFLSSLENCPLAVATNAEPANISFVLAKADLQKYFRVIVSGHDVKRPKPFPDIYLHAARLLHTAPEYCIVFEDSRTGVAAARAAGTRVVGIQTTLAEFEDVDLVIRDFNDPNLVPWLSSNLLSV